MSKQGVRHRLGSHSIIRGTTVQTNSRDGSGHELHELGPDMIHGKSIRQCQADASIRLAAWCRDRTGQEHAVTTGRWTLLASSVSSWQIGMRCVDALHS